MRTTRRTAILATAIAAVALFAGCPQKTPTQSPPAQPPGKPSRRIVSLSPAVSVILRDLGHEREIVGRHLYDQVVADTTPVCGDQTGIDYEALVRARPTHVFTQWGSRELPERLTTMAAAQQWTLRDVHILALDDIHTAVGTLDRGVRNVDDNAPVSPTAGQLQAALDNLVHPQPLPDRSGVGKVLLLIATSPPSALGPGSAHHELLKALGATPALTDAKAYVELTHEQVVRLAPDAIILFMPRGGGSEGGATPPEDPWKPLRPLDLPALRSGKITVIEDPLALLPSTSLIGVGEKMRTTLDAWDAP